MNFPFDRLRLGDDLLKNLQTLGYRFMTPVQRNSIPPILDGFDVIAQARTGSGKTAAFGLGLLQKLEVERFRVQSLVLCPTRELAGQVARELRRLARARHNVKVLTLSGGMPFGPQVGSLQHGAHIVVGTPGRIEEHLRKGTLRPGEIRTLVLDEADRMLDMGFRESLEAIVSKLPRERQTLLFSATYPEQIEALARLVMTDPVMVKVEPGHEVQSIRQYAYDVGREKHRMTALRLLLLKLRPVSTLVFCNTRRESDEVADALRSHGFEALALHGDLDQRVRDQVLVRFANRSVSVLVATDVAARGLDIESLDAVVNYHMARDPEVYVHRIGRTGRAGKKGLACTLYSEAERHRVERLRDELGQPIETQKLPPYSLLDKPADKPPMITLQIDGGRKQKVRPGDLLGALTGEHGIAGKQVGKIDIFDQCAYVAVDRDAARHALRKLRDGKVKGRSFRARRISR